MSLVSRAPLAILLIAAAPAVAAQQGAAARTSLQRVAAVSGTIYDSIARAPLARAVVYLAGTSHTGSTDRSGRFQLEGVPAGRYQVAFTHPVLDTLGIAAPEREVEVRDGGVAKADLYVPSMWSMVKRLCPAGMPREASGLVLGVVRDAESDEPVGAATVVFSWTLLHLTKSGLQEKRHRSETLTQTDGVYAMCGVPVDINVTTRVEVRGRASGEAEVRVGEFSLVRRDLSVAVPRATVAADSGAAVPVVTPDSGVTLVGFVTSADGKPMPAAQAFLSGTDAFSTSDSAGRFRLTNLPLGTQTIEVRRLGWMPARLTVELRRHELNLVQVRMTDRAVLLSAVRVKGRALFHDRTGFEQRMGSGLGYYMNRAAIDARNANTFSEILRGAPGVRLVASGNGQTVEMMRSAWSSVAVSCRATYWVDGVRWPPGMTETIDNLLQPSEIEAVEVYAGPAQTPAQFSGFGVECGTIVVWSRTPQNQPRR